MIREIVKVKLTKEYKEKAVALVEETIDKVSKKANIELSPQDKRKLINLTMDQVNINVSSKAKTKTYWVFDTENHLPVVVEKAEAKSTQKTLVPQKISNGGYKMKPNLVWTYVKKDKETLTQKEFEEKSLAMLLEDFETAAFYGTLSYGAKNDYV